MTQVLAYDAAMKRRKYPRHCCKGCKVMHRTYASAQAHKAKIGRVRYMGSNRVRGEWIDPRVGRWGYLVVGRRTQRSKRVLRRVR